MEMLLVIGIIVSISHLVIFFSESKEFRANHFFSLLTCLFFTMFILVYVFIGTSPKNIETKIIKKNIFTVNSNDSSGSFQNNTDKDFEVIELTIKQQSNRFGILNTLEETKYIIKEKDSTK